ncbi:MAG: signal recognition particle-docking protein FtsY [Lysobacteraceae bacterium]
MFKFWKKKPAEVPPTGSVVEPASAEPADRVEPDAHPIPTTEPDSGLALQEAATEDAASDQMDSSPGVTEHEPDASAIEPVAPMRTSWRERLATSSFARSLGSLFQRNPRLDDDLLDEIETCLLTADVGVSATQTLIEDLRRRMHKREFADAPALLAALRSALRELLQPVAVPLDVDSARPFVILTVGVNGVGKTTSIGKLAWRYQQQGKSVVLAAGDTFRAAAVEQLKTWGARHQVPVISQGQNADSASVIFDALQSAQAKQFDLLIADTAGRLHTQSGLMEELAKVRRVLTKLDPAAPHEVLMVIDGTTGQNAVNQVRQFRQHAGVTGLVVTKLDGTAKGGVIFALAKEFGLPIRFVGLGEKAPDLREFDPAAFVDALLPATLG